jgi:hypothetical protein
MEFVSVYEIAKQYGSHRSFVANRDWVLESLKLLEAEGLVESNDNGDYRLKPQAGETLELLQSGEVPPASVDTAEFLKTIQTNPHQPDDTTEFLKALQTPGVDLGDTAIITIHDVERQS